MFKYVCFLCMILFGSASCSTPGKKEALVNQIISQHSKIMKKRNFYLIGSGGAVPDNVKGIILHYRTKRLIGIPEARKIYVQAMEELLTLTNSNEDIRQYMDVYPFGPANIELTIDYVDSDQVHVNFEHVALTYVARGNLVYSYYDKSKGEFIHALKVREKYEDAKRIVNEEA